MHHVYDIIDSSDESSVSTKEEESEPFDKVRNKSLRPSTEEALELELKKFPECLEYAFLAKGTQLPIIIALNLTVEQKKDLVNVLKKHTRKQFLGRLLTSKE